jgi:surface-anchored protein
MKRKPRLRLRIEHLEDRAVPATLSNFLTDQHTDVNLGYTSGTNTWSLQARENDTPQSFPADDVVLYVGKDSATTRPGGSEFDFIGVDSGETFYRLPQSQDPNLIFLGFAGYGLTASDFDRYNPSSESKGRASGVGRWARISLVDVQGPGTFSIWQSGDTSPTVLMSDYNDNVSNPDANGLDTTDGISAHDSAWIVTGGHIDYNWGFSAKGRYEVTIKASGYLSDGNDSTHGALFESGPIKFYFSVGNVGQLEFDASSYAVNENTGDATITVHRINGSDGQLTVNYATSNGTAISGSDYTASSGTLTFADQETSKTITIPITNDSADESNETINLALSAAGPSSIETYVRDVEGSNLLGPNATAVLSILNDDSPGGNTPPTISDVVDSSTNEDTATGAIPFDIGDTESAIDDLVVTATSSNPTLVPNANVVIGGTGANRTVTISPVANLFGSTTITLTVTDTGGLIATDQFLLTVDPINDAPTANGQSVSTPQETGLPITFTGSDIENDLLTFDVVDLPTHGILSGTGANRIYTPTLGYTGPDSFTFKANDGLADSLPATVSITVTPENVPIASADAYAIGAGSVLHGNVLTNDTDADGDPLIAAEVTAPLHGTLNLGADGSFTYTPGPTFAGSDSFTYEVEDDTGRTATTTATISAATPQPFEAVVLQGHTDVGIAYEDGAWEPHIHDEANDIEYETNGAVLYVGPAAERTRPVGSQFDFIGAAAGDTIWQLPHSPPNPELLQLGFGTEEIEGGTFQDGLLRIRLLAVNGPGQFSVWRSTDLGPDVFMATSDGITEADTFVALEGGHADLNWGFTSKGRYEVTIQPWGFLDDGNSDPDFGPEATYYFSVDNLGRIEFSSVNVGVAEGKTVVVKVIRTGGSDGPATVTYVSAPGTATAADFTAVSGDLVFADGETEKTFAFTTRKDPRNEPVETATVSLAVPDGSAAQLGTNSTATLSIDKPTALKVSKVTINDGLKQRSNIETISIKFSRDTNVAALISAGTINDAVKVFSGATEVALATNRFYHDAARNTLVIGLTTGGFDPDSKTILANGRYELRLDTAKLTTSAGGVSLMDSDKTLDGVHRLAFHRLEGDFNGDKKVTKADEGLLRKYLGSYFWQRRYNFAFDLTGAAANPDGGVDLLDVTYLRTLFGLTV